MGLRFAWVLIACVLGLITLYGAFSESAGYITGILRWLGVVLVGLTAIAAIQPALGRPTKNRAGDEVNPVSGISAVAILGTLLIWADTQWRSRTVNDLPRQSKPTAALMQKQVAASPLALAQQWQRRQDADEALVVGRWIDPIPYRLGVAIIKQSGKGYVLLAEPTEVKHYQLPLEERDRGGRRRFWM